MNSVPVWVAITLPFVGYVVAVLTEYLRGWQDIKREREARLANRIAAREDARDAFERDTLIALQDSMQVLMRNVSAIHHQDEMEFLRSAKWGRNHLPHNLGGEDSAALVRDFERLRVRVLDDALRQQAKDWWEIAATVIIGASRDEDDEIARKRSKDAWENCMAPYQVVMESIGGRLRRLVSLEVDKDSRHM